MLKANLKSKVNILKIGQGVRMSKLERIIRELRKRQRMR